MRVAVGSPRRADVATAMREHEALVGGGPSGRYWYGETGFASPDIWAGTMEFLCIVMLVLPNGVHKSAVKMKITKKLRTRSIS